VFFLPSLKSAAVTLRLDRAWTEEQLAAALKAYGGEWELVRRDIGTKIWEAPDGTIAIQMLNSLHIQSKAVMDLVNTELAEREGKREAVPQF